MSDWVNTALPIATLTLGSLLTMAGQALGDRRADKRDQRSHREEFLARNFEMHRSAMLEMQELVSDLYKAFSVERVRRRNEGFYKYFEDWPFGEALKRMAHGTVAALEMTDAIVNAASKAEQRQLTNSLKKDLKTTIKDAGEMRAEMERLGVIMASIHPFWKEFGQLAGRLRTCMYRSGSDSVVNSSEAFIDAIYGWNDYYKSDGSQDELAEQVRTARQEVNSALAKALKFGPYDKLWPRRRLDTA